MQVGNEPHLHCHYKPGTAFCSRAAEDHHETCTRGARGSSLARWQLMMYRLCMQNWVYSGSTFVLTCGTHVTKARVIEVQSVANVFVHCEFGKQQSMCSQVCEGVVQAVWLSVSIFIQLYLFPDSSYQAVAALGSLGHTCWCYFPTAAG